MTLRVAPDLIRYLVDSDSMTMQPSEGLPEHEPPWIRKPERPHMLFEELHIARTNRKIENQKI
jgi:hypothetical protein